MVDCIAAVLEEKVVAVLIDKTRSIEIKDCTVQNDKFFIFHK